MPMLLRMVRRNRLQEGKSNKANDVGITAGVEEDNEKKEDNFSELFFSVPRTVM